MPEPEMEALARFFDAIRAGDIEALKNAIGRGMRSELAEHITSEEEREAFFAMQRERLPASFELTERIEAGDPAVVSHRVRAMRETPEGEAIDWLIAEFAEEDGECLIAGLFPAAPPDTDPFPVTKRAVDDRRGPVEDYRRESHSNLGGAIVRAEFGPEYGVLVIRVLDSEETVFLPPREELAASGIDPDHLVPGAIVEVEGHPHATDECKVLGTRLTIHEP